MGTWIVRLWWVLPKMRFRPAGSEFTRKTEMKEWRSALQSPVHTLG
jgi:hypothetical protein